LPSIAQPQGGHTYSVADELDAVSIVAQAQVAKLAFKNRRRVGPIMKRSVWSWETWAIRTLHLFCGLGRRSTTSPYCSAITCQQHIMS